MRDTDDDEMYQFPDRATWPAAVFLIVAGICTGVCCLGTLWILRTT